MSRAAGDKVDMAVVGKAGKAAVGMVVVGTAEDMDFRTDQCTEEEPARESLELESCQQLARQRVECC